MIMTLSRTDDHERCNSKLLNVDGITVLVTYSCDKMFKCEQIILHHLTRCAETNNMFKLNVQQSTCKQIFDMKEGDALPPLHFNRTAGIFR
jgi:hypothetical protein